MSFGNENIFDNIRLECRQWNGIIDYYYSLEPLESINMASLLKATYFHQNQTHRSSTKLFESDLYPMTHIDIKFMMIPILLNEVFSMELSRFY